MRMHGPACPCCCHTRRDAGPLALLFGVLLDLTVGLALAGLAVAGRVGLVLAGRFLAGRVLHRAASEWDAPWWAWAPTAPAGEVPPRAPRSRWARRPGWHRQAARLAVVAGLAGVLLAPLTTALVAASVAAVLAAGVAGALLARHDLTAALTPSAPGCLVPGCGRPDQHDHDPADPAALPASPPRMRVTARRLDREER